MINQDVAFDDEGHQQLTTPFDIEEVERLLGEEQPINDEHIKILAEALQKILSWMLQSGMRDQRGLLIRAIILGWVFLPELRPMSMSELARGMGLHKQSLGRWVDNWKREFPNLKNSHMK